MQTNPNKPSEPSVVDRQPSDSLLTEAQAAAILNIAPTTLKWWRSVKTVAAPTHCRIGGAVRYRRADIQKFIEASAQGEHT